MASKTGRTASGGGGAVAELLLERLPFQILHDQIRARRPSAIDAEVGDIDDVRVLQLAERLGLAREALEKDRVVGDPRVNQLRRECARQGPVWRTR